MFEKILQLFKQNNDASQSQAESEAVVLLLTLMYRIDKKIKLEEQNFLESVLPSLSWNSPIHINIFQADAIRRVDAAIKNNAIKAFIENECKHVSLKGDLIKTLSELASSDGNIDVEEQQIINLVKTALA